MTIRSDLLQALNSVSPLHGQFARFMERLAGAEGDELALAAMLVSFRTAAGDVCLELDSVAGRTLGEVLSGFDLDTEGLAHAGERLPKAERWIASLNKHEVVGSPGEFRPMILDEAGRLYLHRYREYEERIARETTARMNSEFEIADEALLGEGLERLFPRGAGPDTDWQRVAACAAVLRRFTIITGGPGTGKTSTVVKLLALLVEQGLARGPVPSIALAAPTGKAAVRLKNAIIDALRTLPVPDEARTAIPVETFTLHRLLGTIPGSPDFRHNAENPLAHDVVVIDESSMIDIALMARLLDAVRSDARLIIIGDRDQLASVEAGAVLGDLCDTGETHRYSASFAARIGALSGETIEGPYSPDTGPADAILRLEKNFRFGGGSGIGALGEAIRRGDARRAVEILAGGKYDDLVLYEPAGPVSFEELIEERALSRFGPVFSAASPAEAYEWYSRFCVLSALRKGPRGVEAINERIAGVLERNGMVPRGHAWYAGQPVMIGENNYPLGLFNGDLGVIRSSGATPMALRAYFPDYAGGMRDFVPSRLPSHETAYAITVHKSQGSEFESVLLVLPDTPSRVLSRELLYTAITRARKKVEIWGSRDMIASMIEEPTRRKSGLRDALWGRK